MIMMVDDNPEQLTKFIRWFKNESVPKLTELIDKGSFDDLDLGNLNKLYQVFRERFSNSKWGTVYNSDNDPLLVMKFFSNNGMTSAAKDLKEHIIRIFMTGSIEELIYLWEMEYLTYLEELDIKRAYAAPNSPLNKVLNSSSVDERIVSSICKDLKILNRKTPMQPSLLRRWFKNESIPEIIELIGGGSLDNLDVGILNDLYQVFRERFTVTIRFTDDLKSKFFESTFTVGNSYDNPLPVVKFFFDNGISSAVKDMREVLTHIITHGTLKECIYLWQRNYFSYLGDYVLAKILKSEAGQKMEVLNSIKQFYDLEELTKEIPISLPFPPESNKKKIFVNFLKKKLHESSKSFREEAFPLISYLKDKPEFVDIIKNEVLKEEIDKINDFEKLGGFGSVIYDYEDSEAFEGNDPNAYFYLLYRETIKKSGLIKIYYFDHYPEIYVSETKSAENAVDLVIYDQITYNFKLPGIPKKEEILALYYEDLSNIFYEDLSYVGLDDEIAKGLIYTELKMYFTQRLEVIEIRKEDMDLSKVLANFVGGWDWPIEELQEELFWEDVDNHMISQLIEEKEIPEDIRDVEEEIDEDYIYQKLIEQKTKEEEHYIEIEDSYISNVYKELTNANLHSSQENDRFKRENKESS